MSNIYEVSSSRQDSVENEFKAICRITQNFQCKIIKKVQSLGRMITYKYVSDSGQVSSLHRAGKKTEFQIVVVRIRFIEDKFKVIMDKINERIDTLTEIEQYNLLLNEIEEQQNIVEKKNIEFKQRMGAKRNFDAVDVQLNINRKKIFELKKLEVIKRKYIEMVMNQRGMTQELKNKIENIEKMEVGKLEDTSEAMEVQSPDVIVVEPEANEPANQAQPGN